MHRVDRRVLPAVVCSDLWGPHHDQAFCIDALPPRMPRNDTTRGDPRFADYASCNNQPDKSASNCTCAVAADRYS